MPPSGTWQAITCYEQALAVLRAIGDRRERGADPGEPRDGVCLALAEGQRAIAYYEQQRGHYAGGGRPAGKPSPAGTWARNWCGRGSPSGAASMDRCVAFEQAVGASRCCACCCPVALAERRKPDVVIMDVRMPGMDGLEATKLLTEKVPGTAVLIFTAYSERSLLGRGLESGAKGYILKEAPHQTLLKAIDKVVAGEGFVDPALMPAFLSGYRWYHGQFDRFLPEYLRAAHVLG